MGSRLDSIKRAYAEIPDRYGRIAFWVTTFLGVPAFMVWLALKLWWFWRGFGAFGVAMVILTTWALLTVCLAALEIRRYMRNVTSPLQRLAGTEATTQNNAEIEAKKERKELLNRVRSFVASACAYEGANTDFRASLEGTSLYFQIRPHLSEKFREEVRRSGRVIIAAPPGSKLPGLAHEFLDELDRLEREWGMG